MKPRVVSTRCEDYPCCGHGPAPYGDGGGCPVQFDDGTERWPCARCGALMPVGNRSAICDGCHELHRRQEYDDYDPYDDYEG